MSDAAKAVFLSYASQDSEAAKKICEALRGAGIEVWFDQSELRGGDAWDQKIRQQIKECALFVPIISANTQARQEGYFRLEWRLADQRTHLMSHDRAFIVPVVVDDTRDEGARVPDSFVAVQWTRLPAGAADSRFVERVREMLSLPAPGGPASAPAESVRNQIDPGPRGGGPSTYGRRKGIWLGAATALALLVAGFVAFRPTGTATINPEPKTQNPEPKDLAPAKSDDKSLAVLPLENLSPDPENAFFTEGMHSEIISTLLRASDLKVISRNSALVFKDGKTTLPEIGQKLGVANVITGNVRRAGDRVRIQLELRRASDEAMLWTQVYDRELKDVFAIQSEVAEDVSRVLKARDFKSPDSARFMTKDPRAYDLYLKAREYRSQRQIGEAIRAFQDALKLDPAYVNAASELSSAHAARYMEILDPEEKLHHAAEAKRWGETAARLLPGGAGDRALSYYYAVVEFDAERALKLAQNSVRAWPNDPGAHNTLAIALNGAGRVEEAIIEYRKALSLDPLVVVGWQNLINWLSRLRRVSECHEAIARCMEVAAGREEVARMALARFVLGGELPRDLGRMPPLEAIAWLGRRREFAAQLAAVEKELGGSDVPEGDRFALRLFQHDALRQLGRASAAADASLAALQSAEKLNRQPELDRSLRDGRLAAALTRVGRVDDAMRAGRRYVEAVSAGNRGRVMWDREVEQAELYAMLNRPKECVELLGRLLRLPSGVTVPMLRVDPVWDNLREDAGFKALLADPKNSAPL